MVMFVVYVTSFIVSIGRNTNISICIASFSGVIQPLQCYDLTQGGQ